MYRGKVMFSQVSVNLFMGGGVVGMFRELAMSREWEPTPPGYGTWDTTKCGRYAFYWNVVLYYISFIISRPQISLARHFPRDQTDGKFLEYLHNILDSS